MVTANISCGLKIGEDNVPVAPAKVSSAACLELSIQDLKLYFSGEATDDQVVDSLQCLQDVFIAFKENIRGENKDVYTAREIANFIEKNFLKSADSGVFTNSFLTQFMKFKVALIGGNEKYIHKTEIDKISSLIATFKPELVRLNKSMKILTFKWTVLLRPVDQNEKEKLFLAAKADLANFVHKVSLEFVKTNNAYQIDDLINFLKEISIMAEAGKPTLELFEKARPFVKKFKTTLIGGDYSLQSDEWTRLGLTLSEGFFQALRIEYFVKDLNPEDVDLKWAGYEKIAVDLCELVETLLISKDTRTLSNFELFELSQTLGSIFPDFYISINLLDSLGYVKVALLGDSPSGRLGWSNTDFLKLRQKIPVLFHEFSKVFASYNSLKNPDSARISFSEFQSIEDGTLLAVQNLASLIEKPYNLYSLRQLLTELSKGLLKDTLNIPENFESLFNVATAFKTVITSQEDNNLTVENMKLLMEIGSRSYFHFLQYTLFVKPYDVKSFVFYENTERLLPKIQATLATNLAKKPGAYFSTAELAQLFVAFQHEGFSSPQLTTTSLNLFLNGLWTNILNPVDARLAGKSQPGLNDTALQQLLSEFQTYLQLQKTFISIFSAQTVIEKEKLKAIIDAKISTAPNALLKEGLQETKALLGQGIALNFDDFEFLKISTDDIGRYHLVDLTKTNLGRALSRLLIRSYAMDRARIIALGEDAVDEATTKASVTLQEASLAFTHFAGAAKDLEFLQANVDVQFIVSRFREANLFLSTSDGDNFANFSELHSLILHILSGIKRADMIKQKVLKKCPAVVPTASPLELAVSEDCLLQFYSEEKESFSNLPKYLSLKSQFSAEQMQVYYLGLLKTAGHVPTEKKLVKLIDADLFPHIVQYIEMVFARYDHNQNQALEKDEALEAFPVYHDLIKDLSKDYNLKETELPGVFIYLLKYTRPPKTLLEKISFKTFIGNPDKWIIQSTRLDLGKIFNFIADSTKPKSLVPTETL